jgi:hypothetical protein
VDITPEQIIIGVVVIVGGLFAYGYYEGLTSGDANTSSGDSNTTFGILVGLFAGAGVLGLGILAAL